MDTEAASGHGCGVTEAHGQKSTTATGAGWHRGERGVTGKRDTGGGVKRRIVTREIAQAICADYDNNAGNINELAEWYKFHHRTIYAILSGKKLDGIQAQTYIAPRQHSTERLFTNDEVERIRNMHHEGYSVAELERLFGAFGSRTIRQILEGTTYKDAGGQIGIISGWVTEEQVIQVRQLYRSGKATHEIMKITGLNRGQIHHMAKKEGRFKHLNDTYPPIEKIPFSKENYLISPGEREWIRMYFQNGHADMTMTEMAEAYGVSLSYISRIVKGERK